MKIKFLALSALTVFALSSAHAGTAPLGNTWTLQNVTFASGDGSVVTGTASGSFTVNIFGYPVYFDITTTKDSKFGDLFPGRHYSNSLSTVSGGDGYNFVLENRYSVNGADILESLHMSFHDKLNTSTKTVDYFRTFNDPNSLSSTPEIFMNVYTSSRDISAGSVFLSTAPAVPAVPEPETYALLLAGLGAMGFVANRRKPL